MKSHLINIPGWRTDRKIVVFESDDWGAIRMPSKKAYHELLEKGIRVDQSVYDSKDCLENKKDFELLCEVLSNHQRANSQPVFTLNTVLGNPDFDKIKEDKFSKFYHEHFLSPTKNIPGPIWNQYGSMQWTKVWSSHNSMHENI